MSMKIEFETGGPDRMLIMSELNTYSFQRSKLEEKELTFPITERWNWTAAERSQWQFPIDNYSSPANVCDSLRSLTSYHLGMPSTHSHTYLHSRKLAFSRWRSSYPSSLLISILIFWSGFSSCNNCNTLIRHAVFDPVDAIFSFRR